MLFHLSELVKYETNNPKEHVASPKWSVFSSGSLWCLGLAPIWEKAPTFGGGVYVTRGLLSDLFRECFVWFFAFVFWQCERCLPRPLLLLCIVVRERFLDTAITLVVQHYVIARLSTEVDFVYGPMSFGLR